MTWIDNNGEVRPQSWEEYLAIRNKSPDRKPCNCGICERIRKREAQQATAVKRSQQARREVERLPRMRIRLFRADPHCFWCGCAVELTAPHGTPNLATVDHLYSRFHPERKAIHNQRDRPLHVLACHACNNERGVCEQRQKVFTPKLKERLSFAQAADATLAIRQRRKEQQVAVRQQRSIFRRQRKQEREARVTSVPLPAKPTVTESPRSPMLVIGTLEEAVVYARENPAR